MSFFKGILSSFTESGIEMPGYTVVADHGDYEEREYASTKWATRKCEKMQHREAVRESFWKLFKYIQGKNEKEIKIDMTAPVATRVVPGAGPNCESTFITSFFIGKEHTEDPAKPSDPEVYIDSWEPMTVFVRRFGGFANDEKWISEAAALAEGLKSEHKVEEGFYYTCGYNSPFKLFNRRNEVWLVKKVSEE